ncbi:hypothetical protein ACFY2H_41410 [Streptomyces griseofuscus]|uniref:hypothetical protein n=1 Tax=Streptomyces griseofuscus TaxID=146922 RepID=UPI0036AFD18B
MAKRRALAVTIVAAAFTTAVTGTAATALSDGPATRILAGDRPVAIVKATTGASMGISERPNSVADTSWGG